MHKCAHIVALMFLPLSIALADDAATLSPLPSDIPITTSTAAGTVTTSSGSTLTLGADVGLASDGTTKDEDSYQVRVGELYAPGGECYVMAILLAPLPTGQQFKTVHLRMQLVDLSNENGIGNADLYALGVRDAAKVLPTDYYQGSADTKATLVQANFLTPKSTVRTSADTGPYLETSADADKVLAQYLNALYAKPENIKKYVVLRISYDVDPIPTGNNGYLILTSRAGGASEQPVISYTLAPSKQ